MPLPDGMPDICLALRTRMASRAVTRLYNARMRPLGLQITQFVLLVAISRSADFPIATMAERLDIEPSALLRNLKLLEDKGLVVSTGGRGRRGRRLGLTDEGRKLLETAAPAWARAQAELRQALAVHADEVLSMLKRLEAAALGLEGTE